MVGHYASYAHGYNGQDENGKKLAKQARKLDIHPLPPSPFLRHCQLGHHSFSLYGPPRYVVLSSNPDSESLAETIKELDRYGSKPLWRK